MSNIDCDLMAMAKALEVSLKPSVVYKPKVFKSVNGNYWAAYGDVITPEFRTPKEAMAAFDKIWEGEL